MKETFKFFLEQDAKVLFFSFDNPLTVSEIAKSVEIPSASKHIDANSIITDEDMEFALNNYVVFGRVKPEQKQQIVAALRKKRKESSNDRRWCK